MNIEYNQLIDVFQGRPTRDSIVCESTIPESTPIFENHFPDNPILPGALLIEIMAQAGGFIHLHRRQKQPTIIRNLFKEKHVRYAA